MPNRGEITLPEHDISDGDSGNDDEGDEDDAGDGYNGVQNSFFSNFLN